MPGRIDCYIDVVSLYSYFAFADLISNLEKLAAHGVQVEFHPVLLAGIMSATGNRPPWALEAKRAYFKFDADRAAERVGKRGLVFPPDFMSMSLSVLPLRALHFIKLNFPEPAYQTAFHYMFHCFWTPPHQNLTKSEVLEQVLAEVTVGYVGDGESQGSERLFSTTEVKAILHGAESREMRELLKKTTQEALTRGAFGAPWLWVTNADGVEEPFFGSDRFHFVYKHLGIPFQSVAILAPGKAAKSAKI